MSSMSVTAKRRAGNLIKDISKVESFDQLYKLLDFKYVLDPGGISIILSQKFRLYHKCRSAGACKKDAFKCCQLSEIPETDRYSIHSIN